MWDDDSLEAFAPITDMPLDPGIRRAVLVLRRGGIETFESCSGEPGHAYLEPTVRFHGQQSAGWRALTVAQENGLRVRELRRVWPIIDGEPTGPWWEMTFQPEHTDQPIPQPAPEPAPPYDCCPVCGGDCGSANPPVTHCPMRPDPTPAKVARAPVTEEMRQAIASTYRDLHQQYGHTEALYRGLTAALAAAPPDPLREEVERFAAELETPLVPVSEWGSGYRQAFHEVAARLRALLETGR